MKKFKRYRLSIGAIFSINYTVSPEAHKRYFYGHIFKRNWYKSWGLIGNKWIRSWKIKEG